MYDCMVDRGICEGREEDGSWEMRWGHIRWLALFIFILRGSAGSRTESFLRNRLPSNYGNSTSTDLSLPNRVIIYVITDQSDLTCFLRLFPRHGQP